MKKCPSTAKASKPHLSNKSHSNKSGGTNPESLSPRYKEDPEMNLGSTKFGCFVRNSSSVTGSKFTTKKSSNNELTGNLGTFSILNKDLE